MCLLGGTQGQHLAEGRRQGKGTTMQTSADLEGVMPAISTGKWNWDEFVACPVRVPTFVC